ncbi:hypothetical protein [Thermosporothrix hazakensis]|uniref:Uncharacterized protein n=1 Tax=Thermosporothrix sp. COM3 TaxID=2490863 RepID=A0A455SL16_9CHLR|nr:hypothetical protein [Thermosporothrix hazakensis]BBH86865.1 hypothetical protein KTC_16160 [Thermosporothrix sp. COM3]GCE51161.1 hypothetical protein KTH_60300 [Thermosporothrix hazakensis]
MKNERSADDGARAIYRPVESECSIREQAGAAVLAGRATQAVLTQPAHPQLEMLEIICNRSPNQNNTDPLRRIARSPVPVEAHERSGLS